MVSKKAVSKNKNKVGIAISATEKKLLENYKKVASMSGEDWKKVSGKYKTQVRRDMSKARKRINTTIKNNPEKATIAAAVIGALAGALIMSKIRKK